MKVPSTTGVLFILSLLEQKGPISFLSTFRLSREYFTDLELQILDVILRHADIYKTIPDKVLVEVETKLSFPELPLKSSLSYWADEVRKRYAVENAYELCKNTLDLISNGDIDNASEIATKMTRILIEGQTKTKVYSFEDAYDNILDLHNQARLNIHNFGIPFGFDFLDSSSGGAQGGDLIVLAGRPACLSADTKILIRSSNSTEYKRMPISSAFYYFSQKRPVKNNKMFTLSCDIDGKIITNEIKSVIFSGVKTVYEVKTKAGLRIKATKNHRFLVGNGIYSKLADLAVGDIVQIYNGSLDEIINIEKIGEEQTYDIEMCNSPHNFLANDFFVHNSGKTFILLQMALHAHSKGKNVLLIPTEMSEIQYHRRLIALRNNLSINKIKFGELSTIIGERIIQYDKTLVESLENKFYMTDASMSLGMMDVRSSAYVYKPDALYIDGAYLLRPEVHAKSRYEAVSSVAESLKMLAKEMNIPIFATYQINKKTEDIYQSDIVRQLASIVIEMSTYEDLEEEWHRDSIQAKQLKITKGRDGESGETIILLDTNHTRLVEADLGEVEESLEGMHERNRRGSFIEVDGV